MTQTIDNGFTPDEDKKSISEIVESSLESAAVATCTSIPTGIINSGVKIYQKDDYNLMHNFTPEFGNMLSAFFGAVDDANTYIYLGDKNK